MICFLSPLQAAAFLCNKNPTNNGSQPAEAQTSRPLKSVLKPTHVNVTIFRHHLLLLPSRNKSSWSDPALLTQCYNPVTNYSYNKHLKKCLPPPPPPTKQTIFKKTSKKTLVFITVLGCGPQQKQGRQRQELCQSGLIFGNCWGSQVHQIPHPPHPKTNKPITGVIGTLYTLLKAYCTMHHQAASGPTVMALQQRRKTYTLLKAFCTISLLQGPLWWHYNRDWRPTLCSKPSAPSGCFRALCDGTTTETEDLHSAQSLLHHQPASGPSVMALQQRLKTYTLLKAFCTIRLLQGPLWWHYNRDGRPTLCSKPSPPSGCFRALCDGTTTETKT